MGMPQVEEKEQVEPENLQLHVDHWDTAPKIYLHTQGLYKVIRLAVIIQYYRNIVYIISNEIPHHIGMRIQ